MQIHYISHRRERVHNSKNELEQKSVAHESQKKFYVSCSENIATTFDMNCNYFDRV